MMLGCGDLVFSVIADDYIIVGVSVIANDDYIIGAFYSGAKDKDNE